jgi:phosphatidylinositol alpha 1,6-mannosyltransferase
MNRESPTKKTLRVALFAGNYDYIMDGPARALNRLVDFLERQNIAVMVFAPTARTPALEHKGTLISVPSIPIPMRSEYRLGLGITPSIKARLEAFKPTLFHLAAPDLLSSSAIRLARKWDIPVVSSFHTRFDTYARFYGYGFGLLEKPINRYLHKFYSQCAHVYVPSESMADELRLENLDTELRIWSRGVDCERFNPARRDLEWRRSIGFDDDDVVLSFTGRIVLEKGLDFFVEVINALQQQKTAHKVLIVGEGPERAHMQERLPNAHFTGHLSDEPLARAYASADIFFNPSISETFGNVTLEAMASGLPSVCADATGSRSLVQHDTTGYLAPFGDRQAFVRYLTKLIQSKDLRAKQSDAAIKAAHQFDWDTILAGLVSNYRDAQALHLRAQIQ